MEEVDSFISKPRFWFFISLVIIFVVLLILQFAKYMIMKEPIVITPKVSTERGTIYDRNYEKRWRGGVGLAPCFNAK